jgi:hypothetical protein
MPLHSAIANARLKSSIAVDSSCWSWLSQGELFLYLFLEVFVFLIFFMFLFLLLLFLSL